MTAMSIDVDNVQLALVATLFYGIPPNKLGHWWFDAICIASSSVAALLVYVIWRIRADEYRLRLQQECRELERIRIANDIHDTLLQSMQGLLIHVELAAETIPAGEPARTLLDTSIILAEQSIAEGRERILSLQIKNTEAKNYIATLENIGKKLAFIHDMGFTIYSVGTSRELDVAVWNELTDITREAMLNAFRHSQGNHVAVQVCYEELSTQVKVIDDGVGIDMGIILQGGKPGHSGFSTMQYRAKKIGATISLGGHYGSGTIMIVTLPVHHHFDFIGLISWKARRIPR